MEIFIIVVRISGGPPTTYQKFSRGDTVPLRKKMRKTKIKLGKIKKLGNERPFLNQIIFDRTKKTPCSSD